MIDDGLRILGKIFVAWMILRGVLDVIEYTLPQIQRILVQLGELRDQTRRIAKNPARAGQNQEEPNHNPTQI